MKYSKIINVFFGTNNTNNFIVPFLVIQENNYYNSKTLLRINRKYICVKLGKRSPSSNP
jgi:hypothetical protein